MSEEFNALMTEGNQGLVRLLGSRKESKNYRNSLKASDASLLINFLEQREVGERISVESPKAKDIDAPILTKDDAGNIRLQSYLTVLTNTEAGQKILDKIESKYEGFTYIPEELQKEMLRQFMDKYEKKMTGSTGKRVGGGTVSNKELRRELNRGLSIFTDSATNRDITSGRLDRVKGEKLIIDSDATNRDKKEALEIFRKQPDYMKAKVEPFIELLEKVLRLDSDKESLEQPSDVLQDLISKGDLRLTKNRRKIYDYWEEVDGEYENLAKSHNRLISAFKKSYPKTSDIVDPELAEYIEKFTEVSAEQLKYVFKYPSTLLTTVDGKTKTLEILDEFLTKTKSLPDLRETYHMKEATGYRLSNESGGGQVAEIDQRAAAEMGEEVRDYEAEQERIKAFAELVDTQIISLSVDPLYAYAYKMGQSGFNVSPSIAGEMKSLMNRAKKTAIRLDLDNSTLRELKKYINEIDMKTVISEGDFYLPHQENVMDTVPGYKSDNPVNTKYIREYLTNLSQFISAGSESERPLGTGVDFGHREPADPKTGKKFEVITEGKGVSLPSKGLFRTKLPELGKVNVEIEEEKQDGDETVTVKVQVNLEKEFNNLLDAVKKYYLEPATSDAKPLARKFEWVETQTLSVLSRGRMKKNAFITMLGLQMSEKNPGGVILDEADLRLLITFLKRLSTNVTKQSVTRFLSLAEDAARAVDDAFEGDDSEAVSMEFGNMAYKILKKNSIETEDLEFGVSGKKKLKEWSEEYEKKKNNIFPFAALYYHITSSKEKYSKLGSGYVSIISDIKNIEDKLDVIRKSELEINFLNAHDNIRKMMNKPLYFGISSVDNYEDMQNTLSIMKSNFNTDLTAMEVEGIVKELDSMANISQKYGISREGVYYLKAIHR